MAASGNQAIRHVDLVTRIVSTLLAEGLNYSTGIAYDTHRRKLYISNELYISKLDNENGVHSILSGSINRGGSVYYTAPLATASYRYPFEMISLTENLLLVSNQYGNKLRLLDFEADLV